HRNGTNYPSVAAPVATQLLPHLDVLVDYRQNLNNYIQEVYRGDPRRRLTWETSHEGPDNRPTWQAIAFCACKLLITPFRNQCFIYSKRGRVGSWQRIISWCSDGGCCQKSFDRFGSTVARSLRFAPM
ncbi:hypothetical protein J3R82DRAFT_375, partial [Butyriboletus roseoflavus]